jgi:Ca2+-binding EF-hand superfamily protein
MFLFFDKDANGFIDFSEFVKGLDVVERGTFDEKVRFSFDVCDIYAL